MSRKEMTSGQLRILQAVARLLENPANKITVQRIAQEIHVTDGAIYRHYKSKDEIFEAIATYMESNLLGPLNTAHKQEASGENSAAKRLHFTFEQHMTFLEGHPGLARMLLGGGSTEAAPMAERLKLLNAKVRSQVAQLFKMAQAQGTLATGTSPEQTTEVYYGLLAATAVAHAFNLPQVNAVAKWDILQKSCLVPQASA